MSAQGIRAENTHSTVSDASTRYARATWRIVASATAMLLASITDVTPTLPMAMFTLFQKRLLGSLYGEANPRADIPRLLSLYREGKLLLDETVTAEYKLNDINEAYDDMLAGRNIRGVIIHDH